MNKVSASSTYKTCYLINRHAALPSTPAPVKGAYKCLFVRGDGTGGTETRIGNQKGNACINACVIRKRKDPRINGVTVYSSNQGGCWCEMNMNKVSASSTYKTCYLINRYAALPTTTAPVTKAKTVTKCNKVADVGFILDSSGSLAGSYKIEKAFLKSVAAAFGISKDGPRASVVTFSLKAELSIKFKDYFDITSFNNAVDAIPLMGRLTRIDLALRVAQNDMFTTKNGARAKTPKILILLTDGSQTQSAGAVNPADISKKLRQNGIHVIVVGIGSGINRGELIRIAGSDDKVFSAASFAELVSSKFTEKLMEKSCKEVAV